jgi:uncharacterized tellurite resistance protein B-like protein
MAIADLKNVLKIFSGSDVSADQESELFTEVLLMTLARAANADVSIQQSEVDLIRKILKSHTGEDFSAADIRVAARAELYAEATLVKYLNSVYKKLTEAHRVKIVQALADVFRADASISVLEQDFFDNVVKALHVKSWQVAGLTAGDVS